MKFGKPVSELGFISRSPENQVGGSVYLSSPASSWAKMKTGTRFATEGAAV